MAFEVVLPRLGWSMESGRLVEWLKKDGEAVQAGEMLFSVEGDKAIQEVEALETGILRVSPNCPGPDQDVPVGTLLAYICQPGETPPSGTPDEPVFEPSPTTEVGIMAEMPAASIQQTGVPSPSSAKISPRARRVARELGIDWTDLTGTGITGRIRERDVRSAASILARQQPAAPTVVGAAAAMAPSAPIANTSQAAPITDGLTVSSGVTAPADVRQPASAQVVRGPGEAAPVTLMTSTDATRLYELQRDWKNDSALAGQAIPSTIDVLARLVAQALGEFPILNARLEGSQIVTLQAIHLGITIHTETGSLVPVVRNAQAKGLRQMAAETASFAARVGAGQLTLDETSGSTFTLVDLGMYDVDGFTPLIRPPECAVLGIGRVAPQVVVEENGQTAVRRRVTLSLTFDHRIVDGAPAARFLKRVKDMLERPYFWLLS